VVAGNYGVDMAWRGWIMDVGRHMAHTFIVVQQYSITHPSRLSLCKQRTMTLGLQHFRLRAALGAAW
jgi:hypothetical protein